MNLRYGKNVMKIEELNGKHVAILGYGREGRAMEEALKPYNTDVTIRDQKDGPDYLKGLDEFDFVIKSPGIPPQPEFESLGEKLTNSTQIFLDTVSAAGATVVGITGSKGKSTTASLIFEILKAARKDAHLVGNIGDAAIAHIDSAKPNTIFVQEMSSFQLMDLTVSPPIAVITSLFPEHLDVHGDMASYIEAKKQIARFKECSFCVYNVDTKELTRGSGADLMEFTASDSPVSIGETNLLGEHNLSNIAAAYKTTTDVIGVDSEIAIEAIKKFNGLEHRLQSLGIQDKIEWIDDAISTTPDSTIAGINALGDSLKTIIVGGKDRGIDQSPLLDAITNSPIETVIAMGETASQFPDAINVETMEEAVQVAKEKTPAGTICLLSPAAPSYDMFRDFEEKGDDFKKRIGL